MNELILLVEDNVNILRGNERMLRLEGYDVMCALQLSQAKACMDERTPDVIVLDIMLPDGSGLDFLRQLRQYSEIPVLLLTGLSTNQDIVSGLLAGGDDYLIKPYDFDVLLARLKVILRWANRATKVVSWDGLKMEILAGRAYLHEEDLLLSPKEFAVLLLLAENMGKPISARHICENVWKREYSKSDTSMKTIISRLRSKIESDYTIVNDRIEDTYIMERLIR
ncbi:MAG: response regulator transcription factor [Lachnospiraceae bacterium]|nr:response regulator transcription factor [Lachnospiraceae bacterium]